MVISIKEKKTITIKQEVGNREISSGLEKLKSLQKKITDEPELLSKFISENLDTSYNFESLKSNREESNRSIIYNNRALYRIDTKPIIDFLEGFILKNPISGHYRIREGNSREILYELIFEEIFNKFKMINDKLFLNVTDWKYLLYFDYQTGELSPVNKNHDKTISISLSNKKYKSSPFDKFDKLCIGFSNTIWNNDSRGFDKLLVDVLKRSIEDKVKELLMCDYTLDDVEFEGVPLSLLTDNEIKSILFGSSYKKKFDFSSMNKVILKTKDPSQIDRLLVLMREVVLEN